MLSTYCFTLIGPYHIKPSGQLLYIHWMPHIGHILFHYDHIHQLHDLIWDCLLLAIELNPLDGPNTHSWCLQVLANTRSIMPSILYTQLEMVDTTLHIPLEQATEKPGKKFNGTWWTHVRADQYELLSEFKELQRSHQYLLHWNTFADRYELTWEIHSDLWHAALMLKLNFIGVGYFICRIALFKCGYIVMASKKRQWYKRRKTKQTFHKQKM